MAPPLLWLFVMDQHRPRFVHDAADVGTDEKHRAARVRLATSPPLQVVAELLAELRNQDVSWWTPEFAHQTWPAVARMRWLAERPDIRQRITTELTGLPPNTARHKTPEYQADLIETVLDNGDVTVERFDRAFCAADLVVYGPASEFWTSFCDRMPWETDTPRHQKLVAWLFRVLLADRSSIEGIMRKPVMTPWELRSAIDPMAWQSRVPVEIRAEVDSVRLRQERARSRDVFTSRQELAICTPEIITANVPLRDLVGVMNLAARNMGFEKPADAETKNDAPGPMSMRQDDATFVEDEIPRSQSGIQELAPSKANVLALDLAHVAALVERRRAQEPGSVHKPPPPTMRQPEPPRPAPRSVARPPVLPNQAPRRSNG